MKRMSIAEQTLKKQIERLTIERDRVDDEMEKLRVMANTYTEQIIAMNQEMKRLQDARQKSSNQRKAANDR